MAASPTASTGAPPGSATLLVLAATVALAFKGILARLAYAEGLTVPGLVLLRVGIATPLFVAGSLLLAGRAPPGGPRPGWRTQLAVVGSGVFYLFAALCDFEAIARIGAGPSRVILFSFPGVVLFLEALRHRRPPTPRKLVAFVVAWSGIALVALGGRRDALPVGWRTGVLWAIAAATSYGVYLFVSQRLLRALGSIHFVGLANVGTAVGLVVLWPLVGSPSDLLFSGAAVAWIAVMAVFCTVLPFYLLFEGIRRAGASHAAVLTLAGPPITVAAAWLLLGERLAPLQLAGASLVVLGVAILNGALDRVTRTIPGGGEGR